MTEIELHSSPENARRRHDLETRLRGAGLGRRGVSRALPPWRTRWPPRDRARRLCEVLEGLGPIAKAFGIYLSTRADLLLARECLDLAAIRDAAAPMPIDAVRESVGREVGCEVDAAFRQIDEIPADSRLLYQVHHAVMISREQVTLKIVRPDTLRNARGDLARLHSLAAALNPEEWPFGSISTAVRDFEVELDTMTNLSSEIEALVALSHDAEKLFEVPKVHENYSGPRLLVTARVDGENLANVMSRTGSNDESAQLAEIGRRLSGAFLFHAVSGRWFPVVLRPEDVVLRPNGCHVVAGGRFAKLDSRAADGLGDYLTSVTIDDPDKACQSLLREMEDPHAARAYELRHRFRQIVPFRDGGWERRSSSPTLGDQMFVQWRLAQDHGFRPNAGLLDFCRGLFAVSRISLELAPDLDTIQLGFADVRPLLALEGIRKWVARRPSKSTLAGWLGRALDFPHQIDDLLTTAEDGLELIRLSETERHRRKKESQSLIITLIVVLALGLTAFAWARIGFDHGAPSVRTAILFVLLLSELVVRSIRTFT